MSSQQSGKQSDRKRYNTGIVGVTAIVALLSGLALWVVNASRVNHSRIEIRTGYPFDASSADLAEFSKIQETLFIAFDDLTARIQLLEDHEPRGPGEEGTGPNLERWNEFLRTRVDLVSMFLSPTASVNSNILVRHQVLNVLDVPLEPSQISRLDFLVTQRVKLLDEMKCNYQSLRNAEMLSMVRGGRVKPTEVPAPSDSLLRAVSKTLAKIRAEKEGPDAESYHEILAELKNRPPPGLGIGGSYLMTDGRVYMFKEFPEHLPLSDPAYEVIITLSIQFLNEVLVWFESRGLTRPADIDPILREATYWTPAKQRAYFAPKGGGQAK